MGTSYGEFSKGINSQQTFEERILNQVHLQSKSSALFGIVTIHYMILQKHSKSLFVQYWIVSYDQRKEASDDLRLAKGCIASAFSTKSS